MTTCPTTAATRSATRRAARTRSRTVDSGRPSTAAIFLNPIPCPAISTSRAITSTPSHRLDKNRSSNNTCVTPHSPHFARLGLTPTGSPRPDKPVHTSRCRAQPHGPKRPEHPASGHDHTRPASRSSTSPASRSTMNTNAP